MGRPRKMQAGAKLRELGLRLCLSDVEQSVLRLDLMPVAAVQASYRDSYAFIGYIVRQVFEVCTHTDHGTADCYRPYIRALL